MQVDVALESPDGEVELRAVCAGAVPARDDEWPWEVRPETERAARLRRPHRKWSEER